MIKEGTVDVLTTVRIYANNGLGGRESQTERREQTEADILLGPGTSGDLDDPVFPRTPQSAQETRAFPSAFPGEPDPNVSPDLELLRRRQRDRLVLLQKTADQVGIRIGNRSLERGMERSTLATIIGFNWPTGGFRSRVMTGLVDPYSMSQCR